MSLLSFLNLFYNYLNILPSNNIQIKSNPELDIFIMSSFIITYISVLKFTNAIKTRNKQDITIFKTSFLKKLYSIHSFFFKVLILKGVGFRFEIKNSKIKKTKYLKLKIGYYAPIIIKIPSYIVLKSPKNTRLILKSLNLIELYKFFIFLKSLRYPDSYKGKGFFSRREKFIKKPVIKQNTK